MSSTLPSYILGYHGCSKDVASKLLAGDTKLSKSRNPYDWLGNGIYFWENDPHRAWEWAVANKKISDPDVVGAVIDCGECLNLLESMKAKIVMTGYDYLVGTGDVLPENKPGYPGDEDLVKRNLDCLVMETTLELLKDEIEFDTVRAMFPEGEELYPTAGFRDRNHIQICVRNAAVIRGYFRPIDPDTGSLFNWNETRGE